LVAGGGDRAGGSNVVANHHMKRRDHKNRGAAFLFSFLDLFWRGKTSFCPK
jgi:hypothetical protein